MLIRLLKDALLENKNKELNYVQSTSITKVNNNADSCVSNILNQPCCNQSDSNTR